MPTYEEAEKSKAAEALIQSDLERQRQEEHERFTDITIGTDGMFLCTFISKYLYPVNTVIMLGHGEKG